MHDRVVAVLEGRIHNQRGIEYRVRWQGSDGSDDEWFPFSAVEKDYPELLLKFEDRTGWYPDENGNHPSQHSTTNDINTNDDGDTTTNTSNYTTTTDNDTTTTTNTYHNHQSVSNIKNQPIYSWKSTSTPPPKMTKKELKDSVKVLSKYATEQKLTKNYADIALEYRKQVKYIARSDDEEHVVGAHPSNPPKCSMCKQGKSTKVFFPCQHACVCDACIRQHDIGVLDRRDPRARTWNACPVCVEEIKRVVPLHNASHAEYVGWLHEVKPPIPFVDRKLFAGMGQCLLNGEDVSNVNNTAPIISIGDWLSEEDLPMNEREKRERNRMEHRKRERGERERNGGDGEERNGGCCVVS